MHSWTGRCAACASRTSGSVCRRELPPPAAVTPRPPSLDAPSGAGRLDLRQARGVVTEVFVGSRRTRVEPMRPSTQGRVVACLLRSEVGLLQVFHVLPGEEVLLDDLLLESHEAGGLAGGSVAGVSGFAPGCLRIEVVGVVLVDRGLAGDLHGVDDV